MRIVWSLVPAFLARFQDSTELSSIGFLWRCNLQCSVESFTADAAVALGGGMQGGHTHIRSTKFSHQKPTHVKRAKDSRNIFKTDQTRPSIDARARRAYMLAYAAWSNSRQRQGCVGFKDLCNGTVEPTVTAQHISPRYLFPFFCHSGHRWRHRSVAATSRSACAHLSLGAELR